MGKKLRILLIEDDEVDRKNIQRIINGFDSTFEFIEAKNIKDALEESKKENFDCVLLDYILPDGNAFTFLYKHFDETGHPIPVITLTGMGDEELAVKALKNGATDYIFKNNLNHEALSCSILSIIAVNKLSLRSMKAEQNLTQREKEYRTIIESVSDIIFKLDSEGKITFINPAIKHLGYDPKQLLNLPIQSFIQSELKSEINIHDTATKRVGPRATTDYQARFRKNESSNLFKFLDSITVLLEATGLWNVSEEKVMDRSAEKTFLSSLCVARNITEWKV